MQPVFKELIGDVVMWFLMPLFSTKAGRHFAFVPWDLMQHVATYVLGALMQLLSMFGLYALQARGALSM